MENSKICFEIRNTGIEKLDWQKIIKVFHDDPLIEEVILYGSRANGNYKKYSDIDLTVKGNLNLMQLQGLEIILDDLNLPYKIDLSQYHVITNMDLLSHVERVGIQIYKNHQN